MALFYAGPGDTFLYSPTLNIGVAGAGRIADRGGYTQIGRHRNPSFFSGGLAAEKAYLQFMRAAEAH